MKNEKDLKTHFKFGKNWKEYSKLINEERISEADKSIEKLVSSFIDVKGKSVLDIGCGSGLFSLAFSRLKPKLILSVDIDPDSVATTKTVMEKFNPKAKIEVRQQSVFDLNLKKDGPFDIVYSWGVLHHTGAMMEAMQKAAELTKKGGILVLALYRKTPFCGFWKVEKRIYKNLPGSVQVIVQYKYAFLYSLGLLITGRNPFTYFSDYKKRRGMNFLHDVHDWLGGYPYESISPEEMYLFCEKTGLKMEKAFTKKNAFFGIFGSGCDEYVMQKL